MFAIVCDRCGEILKEGSTVYPVGLERVENGLLSGKGTTIRHLCPGCFCVLAAGFFGRRKPEEPEREEDEIEVCSVMDPGDDPAYGSDRHGGGDDAGCAGDEGGDGADPEEPEESEDEEEAPAAEEAPADGEAPEGETGGRTDIGKVMALHRAGWDTAKIADEMQTDKKKIYNIIWYQKHKNR